MIILASGSPRRRELVRLLGVPVTIEPSAFDEDLITVEDAIESARLTAVGKAEAVADLQPSPAIVIGADTNVAYNGMILGKPTTSAEAIRTLQLLRNQPHQVHTGIAIINQISGETVSFTCTSQVIMRDYSDAEIEAYVATGDPMDKAGSYAIQNRVFHPVATTEGCYANIVGLPVCELANALQAMGVDVGEAAEAHCKAHHLYHPDLWQEIINP